MKNKKQYFILLAFSFTLISCSNKLDNGVTFTNFASENIYVNFLGKVFTIKPTKSVNITEISKGTYAYDTAFDIPSSAKSSSIVGATKGEILMYPQRIATVFYTSQLIGQGEETSYVLTATISYNFTPSDSSNTSINQ